MELQLTIDCQDPDRLVRFWAEALGYVPAPPPEGHSTWRAFYLAVGVPADELGDGDCLDRLVDPRGVGPRLWFQQVPEPKTVKNRLHLDLLVGGGRQVPLELRRQRVRVRADELIALGATEVHVLDGTEGHYAVTLQDPEGNELCLA